MLFLLILLLIFAVVIFAVFGMYNGLVSGRNSAKNAWSQIDVQLKRRHDLIPNLMETVKGYMKHERETLESVIAARTSAMSARSISESGKAEGRLTDTLNHLFAVAEAYPDLKANRNFLSLQEELVSTENKLAFARQAYNDAVMTYNNKTEMVPTNIIASSFNFKSMEFFEVESGADRQVPKIDFS